MPICAHGSERLPSIPQRLRIDAAYMLGLVPNGGEWLLPFIPFLPSIEVDTDAFCALEPPEFPAFTAEGLVAFLINPWHGLGYTTGQLLAQAVHHWLWYRTCRCLIDATPAVPTPTAAPTGLPAVNPSSVVVLPAAQPCLLVDSGPVSPTSFTYMQASPMFRAVSGATRTQVEYQFIDGGAGTSIGLSLVGSNTPVYSAGTTIGPYTFVSAASPHTLSGNFALTGYLYFWLQARLEAGAVGHAKIVLRSWCGVDAGDGQPAGDCSTDPVITAKLERILQLVTLIQRQAVPFAYVPGTVHSGLSGSGQFDVSGILGLGVDLTTTPAYFGSRAGDPLTLWTDSWLNLGTADGWLSRERVTSDPFLILPRDAAALTLVGYTFAPGVEATITELVREP